MEEMEHAEGSQIFEYFKEKELMINVTRHELVPQHAVLNADEKLILLKRYGLEPLQLGACGTVRPPQGWGAGRVRAARICCFP